MLSKPGGTSGLLQGLWLILLLRSSDNDFEIGIPMRILKCLAQPALWRRCAWLGAALTFMHMPAMAQTADSGVPLGRGIYKVYSADINGDGKPDILMSSDPVMITLSIDDDLDIPLPIPGPSFTLMSGAGNSYTLVRTTDESVLKNPAWRSGDFMLISSNTAQNTDGPVLIRANAANQTSFTISLANGEPSLSSTLMLGGAIMAPTKYADGRYDVFTADINNDGKPDLLFRDARLVTFISDDEGYVTPLVTERPNFVLQSGASGYQVMTNPAADVLANAAWNKATGYTITYGTAGTNAGPLLIKGNAAGIPSLVVALAANKGAPQLTQQLTSANVGRDINLSNVTAALKDQNGDGRKDLYVSVNTRLTDVLLADASGAFQPNVEATVAGTWAAMLDAMNEININGVLAYMLPSSYDKYRPVLTSMGSAMKSVPATLKDFQVVEVKPNYAVATVRQTIGGVTSVRQVTFLVGDGGYWYIVEF